MRDILADLKLLAAGIGLGALICAGLVGDPADHVCGTVAIVAVMLAVTLRIIEGRAKPLPRTITSAEMAAGDLYSAAECGLSTLRGLNVTEGGRIQFIRGVLKKHSRYGLKADLAAGSTLNK